jgi:diguanylate cyclase (GGDEF)-like protein
VIGVVDHVTGLEVRTYPLYFAPIAYGAWRLSRRSAVVLALISTGVWFTANSTVDSASLSPLVWWLNALSQLTAFGLVGLLIAELRRRLYQERLLSRLDPLTGLANSRYFHEKSELVLAIARRQDLPIALAYIDLDNFKAVNDAHGHESGDEALRQVAEVLKRNSRTTDIAARLGGDEFALLLLGTSPSSVTALLDRIRVSLAEAMNERGWPVTVSVGALAFERAPVSLREAIHDADALMYRAKRSGKNRVYVEVVSAPHPT